MKTVINLDTGTTERLELTQEELDQQAIDRAAYEAEQAELAKTQYQRDRAEAYPLIGDQLDMIFHAGLGGDEFQAAIQAVKDAHPKGGN